MPFFPYDHHPLRCSGHKPKSGKVLPSLACCFYLIKTDQVGLPWWSHGWLQDSTAGGKSFHPCSGTKILQVLMRSQKTDLFFSPSPPSGCTYPLIIQIFTRVPGDCRVSFICQLRKLQLLTIQTHTKADVLEMGSKIYHQLTLKWLSKMIWVNLIQSICGPHSISWKGFILDLSLPWRSSNSLCWRVPACTTDLGSPHNYVSHFLLFYLLLVFLTEPYFSHWDNSLPVTV